MNSIQKQTQKKLWSQKKKIVVKIPNQTNLKMRIIVRIVVKIISKRNKIVIVIVIVIVLFHHIRQTIMIMMKIRRLEKEKMEDQKIRKKRIKRMRIGNRIQDQQIAQNNMDKITFIVLPYYKKIKIPKTLSQS